MKLTQRSLVAVLAFALVGGGIATRSASAQFSLPGALDPKRAALGAAAKQLGPYIVEQSPVRLDPVDLYPTIDVLPGAPFAPLAGAAANTAIGSIITQLKQSNTGTVTLAPGDYAVAVRLFCMSHARPARAPLAFVLGAMRGKRAPAIIAMNSRASSTPYQFSVIQGTSWTMQGGLGYADFAPQFKSVVDTLIPDYRSQLGTSTLDDIQGKWSSLSSALGGPSLDSVLGQLGGAGRLVTELRDERSQLISQASDFNALSRTFAPLQAADVSTLDSPWGVASPTVWMRLVTRGHYGDVGTVQIRVAGVGQTTVPLISSIGYGRCTPQITPNGQAYACTQPLSFEALRGAPTT